jgi:hypothetical protein
MRIIVAKKDVTEKEVVIHSLRHESLSAVGASGSILDVAAVAGHRSFNSGRAYVHPSMEQAERVSDALKGP